MTFEMIALWFAWVLAGASPGPATLSIAGTAMGTGRRAALIFSLGILAGSATWGIAAALGLSAVMLANVWLFTAIKYAGAAYLLYLAFRTLRNVASPARAVAGRAYAGSARALFTRGALIHLTNPKAILSWGSIYALVLPADATPAQVFGLFAFLYAGSLLIFPGYAILFSSERVVAAYTRARRGFELAFAAFFGAASLKILASSR